MKYFAIVWIISATLPQTELASSIAGNNIEFDVDGK